MGTALAGRLGPIQLKDGISTGNGLALLYAAFFSVCLLAFINFAQPYLLRVNLEVAADQEGSVSGLLAGLQEVVVLLLVAPFGALADRIGRRPVYVFGFIAIGCGYLLCSFAVTLWQLGVFRMLFAVGSAAVGTMLAVVPADYPEERSRGKLIGAVGVCNGLGMALVIPLLGQLPKWFADAGVGPVAAGRWSFGTVLVICLATAVVLRLGLKGGRPVRQTQQHKLTSLVRAGLTAARNPRIALAYGSAFASRGDMVVVGAFFSLWVTQAATAIGRSDADALAKAGMLFGIVQVSALLWAPVIGLIADRVNRVSAMAFAMALGALGFLAIGLVEDPLAPAAIVACVCLGIGQMSAITASQVLIGQEADARLRGSIVGVYSFFGALGLVASTVVGGRLFDVLAPSAPFVMVGVANGILFLWALAVRLWAPGAALHARVAADGG
jgi:MFS family permease